MVSIQNTDIKLAFFVLCMNHEKFIPDLVDSLQKQTFSNFKVYWIDNASTDLSAELAEKLLKKAEINHEVYKNVEGANIPKNLNFLLSKKENEDFIGLISADDYLHPENFEQKINFLNQHAEIPMVYSNGYYLYEDTKETSLISEKMELKGGRIYNDLIKRSFVFSIGTILRSSIFETIGKFDEQVGIEDWDYYLRVSEKYEIGYITQPLFYYRQHSKNMSLNISVKYVEDCFNILKKHKKNNTNYYKGVDYLMKHYIEMLVEERTPFFISLIKIFEKSGIRRKTLSFLRKFNSKK